MLEGPAHWRRPWLCQPGKLGAHHSIAEAVRCSSGKPIFPAHPTKRAEATQSEWLAAIRSCQESRPRLHPRHCEQGMSTRLESEKLGEMPTGWALNARLLASERGDGTETGVRPRVGWSIYLPVPISASIWSSNFHEGKHSCCSPHNTASWQLFAVVRSHMRRQPRYSSSASSRTKMYRSWLDGRLASTAALSSSP